MKPQQMRLLGSIILKPPLELIHTHWSIQNEKDNAAHVEHIVQLGRMDGWKDYMRDQVRRLSVDWPELPELVRAEIIKQKARQ
jgi:hypothetical protein